MSTSVAMRHTLRAHFWSSTTLGVAICLHSIQTKVCPLCAGVVFGNNHRYSRLLHIKTPVLARHDSRHAVCPYSPQTGVCPLCARILGSLSTTLGIVVRLRRSQTGVCLLRAEVPSWLQHSTSSFVASQESSLHLARLLAFPYVFIALRLESVGCVLGLVFFITRSSV